MAENRVKPASKTVMFQEIATTTGLSKKQVASVFESLTKYIEKEIGKKGPSSLSGPATSGTLPMKNRP